MIVLHGPLGSLWLFSCWKRCKVATVILGDATIGALCAFAVENHPHAMSEAPVAVALHSEDVQFQAVKWVGHALYASTFGLYWPAFPSPRQPFGVMSTSLYMLVPGSPVSSK